MKLLDILFLVLFSVNVAFALWNQNFSAAAGWGCAIFGQAQLLMMRD